MPFKSGVPSLLVPPRAGSVISIATCINSIYFQFKTDVERRNVYREEINKYYIRYSSSRIEGLINAVRVRNILDISVGDKSKTFSPFKCVITVPTWVEGICLACTTVLLVFLCLLAVKPWNTKSNFCSCMILGITHYFKTKLLSSFHRIRVLPLRLVCLGFCVSYSRVEKLTLK